MPAAKRPVAGFECKLYLADVTPEEYAPESLPGSGDLTEMTGARDVTIPDAAEELDTSARYDDEKKVLPGMFERGIDFGYQYIRGGEGTDPVFDALQEAYLERSPVCVVAADFDLEEPGTVWEMNWYYVTKLERTEELGGTRQFAVTLKPGVVFGSGGMLRRGMGEISGD